MSNDLISRKALLKQVNENKEIFESERVYLEGLILNAPAVDIGDAEYLEERDADAYESGYLKGLSERQAITIPHDLIDQMAMTIADVINQIDWKAFFDKYLELMKEWKNEEQNRQGN